MRTPSKSAAVRRALPRIHWNPVSCIAVQRHGGRPQSWPMSLNASGGTPTVASRMNSCLRVHTSGLSPDTMNGRSPNTLTRRSRPRRLPLLVGDPLQVGAVAPLFAQPHGGLAHRRRVGKRQPRRPVPPRPLLLGGVDRTERDVGVEPPRLARFIGVERLGPRRTAHQLLVDEAQVGTAEPSRLERPDVGIPHAASGPHLGQHAGVRRDRARPRRPAR